MPQQLYLEADDDLLAGFKKALNLDYDGCGFDRGHMCPFGDQDTATTNPARRPCLS